ncbi:SoxR reducing system RseC family protein [Microbulbifer aestuariivivens]|uniref:SoxR reducing system RseC family protein n=1 Tax=Microbulbifer aestuariivivens TaxID=1908308 RepID=UPI0031E86C4B
MEERGRIVAIEADAIWVETVQRSGCHGCAAKSGCGTGLLGDYWANASRIRVALNSRDTAAVRLNDIAVIGIAEHALTTAALLVYLVPLLALLLLAYGGQEVAGEPGAIVGAIAGLALGALVVRWFSHRRAADPSFSPTLLRIESR